MNVDLKQEAQAYGIPYEKRGRVLVWHDEFDAPEINQEKWSFERSMTGSDRTYDNSEKCCRVEDGKLHMIAHYEEGDPTRPYRLSEALSTKGRMLFRYGYVEMRAKIPYRFGAWPSFWMQSVTPYSRADWFSEIDIYEIFSSPHTASSALHKWGRKKDGTPGFAHCSRAVGEYRFQDYKALNDEYHVYGLAWDEQKLSFYVDDTLYATIFIDAARGNFGADVVDGVEGFHDFHFLLMNNE